MNFSSEMDYSKWQTLQLSYRPSDTEISSFELASKSSFPAGSEEKLVLHFLVDPIRDAELSMIEQGKGDSAGSQSHHPTQVLPTTIKLCAGCFLQARWLLADDSSVPPGNMWNLGILRRSSSLFSALLSYISTAVPLNLNTFHCFPKFHINRHYQTQSSLTADLFGYDLVMNSMLEKIYQHPVVPALERAPSGQSRVRFVSGRECIWLPPAMVAAVDYDIIRNWFDLYPVATTYLGDLSWFKPWHCLHRPTQLSLQSRRQYLRCATDNARDKQLLSWKLLSSLGSCLDRRCPFWSQGSDSEPTAGRVDTSTTTSSSNSTSCIDTTTTNSSISGQLFEGLLPDFGVWPVILSKKGTFEVAKDLLWIDWSTCDLPLFVRNALRQCVSMPTHGSVLVDGVLDEVSLLGMEVIATAVDAASSLLRAPGLTAEDLQRVVRCLQLARTLAGPSNVLSSEAVIKMYLSYISQASLIIQQDSETFAVLSSVYLWAFSSRQPHVISHSLVEVKSCLNDKCMFRLFACDCVYLSRMYCAEGEFCVELLESDNSTERSRLPVVASHCMLRGLISESSPETTAEWRDFFLKCGVQTTLSFEAKATVLSEVAVRAYLPVTGPPKLRSSTPQNRLELPYNLGDMNRLKIHLVDCQLSSDWLDTIARVCGGTDASKGTLLATEICKTLGRCDWMEVATPASTPCAAAALRGKSASIAQEVSFLRDLGIASGAPGSHRIPANSPPPAMKRLYYLPPGQPGAAAVSVGAAAWITVLSQIPWVPARYSKDSPTRFVLPCHAYLPGSQRPNNLDLPTAQLPSSIAALLSSLPASIQADLGWGTQSFPPPVSDLLAKLQALPQSMEPSSLGSSEFSKIQSMWLDVCRTWKNDKLSASDAEAIRKFCQFSTRFIPSSSGLFVSPSRLIETHPSPEESSSLSTKLTDLLRSIGFLCSSEDVSADMLMMVKSLFSVPPSVTSQHCSEFLQACCRGEFNSLCDVYLPYYMSLVFLIKDHSSQSHTALRSFLTNQGVKLLSADKTDSADNIRWLDFLSDIVVFDEKSWRSEIIRELLPKLGDFHIVNPLCHTLSPSDSSYSLSALQTEVLEILSIPRVSDPHHFSFIAHCSGVGRADSLGSQRLSLIIHIIRCLVSSPDCEPTPVGGSLVELIHFDDINLHFSSHVSTDRRTVHKKTFAATNCPIRYDHSDSSIGAELSDRRYAVCGDCDDYAAPLADMLLAQYVGSRGEIRQVSMVFKVLRLLFFLDNADLFAKHVRYDLEAFGSEVKRFQRSVVDSGDVSSEFMCISTDLRVTSESMGFIDSSESVRLSQSLIVSSAVTADSTGSSAVTADSTGSSAVTAYSTGSSAVIYDSSAVTSDSTGSSAVIYDSSAVTSDSTGSSTVTADSTGSSAVTSDSTGSSTVTSDSTGSSTVISDSTGSSTTTLANAVQFDTNDPARHACSTALESSAVKSEGGAARVDGESENALSCFPSEEDEECEEIAVFFDPVGEQSLKTWSGVIEREGMEEEEPLMVITGKRKNLTEITAPSKRAT